MSARNRSRFVAQQHPRPIRTPSPPLSENSSLNSSLSWEYRAFSVSHSRDSSLSNELHTRCISTSVCAGHEPLLRQNSTTSGIVSLSPPPPPVSKRPSLTRRSVSSHCLRQISPKTRTLTAVSSLDNLRNADHASIRNAVYIDGEEVGRRLTELIESQLPDSSSTARFPIVEDDETSHIPSLDSDEIPQNINNKKSYKTRPRGDSLTPGFIFPLSRHSPVESMYSTTPTPTPVPPSTPAFDNLFNVDPDVEQITPTRLKRQSRRQRLVSFISKITSSTPESGSIPTSPSSPVLKHFSSPSSSTVSSSYDYLNSTLSPSSSSRQLSVDEFPVGIEDPDPFARLPISPSVVISPSLERISVPKIQAAPPPLKKRLRAVSLTTGTTFGTSKAAKAARHALVPHADLPVLDIGQQGIMNLTQSPPTSCTETSFSQAAVPLPGADALVPTPRFTHRIKNPFSKTSSPVMSQPAPPPTPVVKKRMSLNPILLPRQPSSKEASPRVPNVGILEHFLFK